MAPTACKTASARCGRPPGDMIGEVISWRPTAPSVPSAQDEFGFASGLVPCHAGRSPPGCLPVGLLKIDVEGLERAVIAGAAELLRRDRRSLVEIYGAPPLIGRNLDHCGHPRVRFRTRFVYADDAGCSLPTAPRRPVLLLLYSEPEDSWRWLPLSTSSAPGVCAATGGSGVRAKRAWARGVVRWGRRRVNAR